MSILTNSPVILVIDTEGITRGIAPLLQGYINFEKRCQIAGVILNKVKTERHENKLINAVKNYTDLKKRFFPSSEEKKILSFFLVVLDPTSGSLFSLLDIMHVRIYYYF